MVTDPLNIRDSQDHMRQAVEFFFRHVMIAHIDERLGDLAV